jgi:formylglycine-generating enzyme required for sulfatase activity
MRRVGCVCVVAAFSLLGTAPDALAQKRVALVIGNSAYQHTPRLTNPKNDATDMSAALKKLGVQVLQGFDLNKAAFDRKMRDFAAALQGAEAGLFFFAGHGLQVAGQNYLVPIDAKLKTASALDFEMVRLDVVQRVMEHETSTNVLFLDACRDNPLVRNLARAMGTRSAEIGRGLAPVESGGGTLISFSTQPGNVALDGTGRNSPFAGALVKYVAVSKDDLSAILIDVRNDVMRQTQDTQVPWEHSALRGRFYFRPPPSVPAPSAPTPPQLSEVEAAKHDVAKTDADAEARAKAEAERQRLAMLRQQDPALSVTPGSGATFRDCPECPEMIVVPAGEFTMGSSEHHFERPPQRVKIQRPFAVGKFEVTFAEWDACVAAGDCNHRPGDEGWGRGRRPVINVSWDDAQEFVAWLSRETGKTYRLLNEAEWEYAARAGTTTRYAFGDAITSKQAQFDADRTAEVGSFPANSFGLHDLHGNVWEWCEDNWHSNYLGAPIDGSLWAGGDSTQRVLRGGSWPNPPQSLRSAIRDRDRPVVRDYKIGFRLARTL